MNSNPRQPNDSTDHRRLEAQLGRLKPVPVSTSAADILRECENHALLTSLQSNPEPRTNWGLLAATGLAGVVIGVLMASTIFLGLQSSHSTLQAENVKPATKPVEQPVASDRTLESAREPVAVAEQWSHVDSRISERLHDFQDVLTNESPLSASSIVRPRLAVARKPAGGIAFHGMQPTQNEANFDFTDEPTIRSDDSATLLLELLDS